MRNPGRTLSATGAGRGRQRWAVPLLTGALLAAAPLAGADIYKYVDKKGHTHFTDRPPHAGYKLVLRWRGKGARAPDMARLESNKRRFAPLIHTTARKHAVDTALLHAVIRAESAYDPNAVSRAGAVGLMQLMPATAQRYGVLDRRDPRQNVDGGTRYLKDLLGRFNDLTLALAAYNAGESAVERHGNQIPPFPETQTYVSRVLTFYRRSGSL